MESKFDVAWMIYKQSTRTAEAPVHFLYSTLNKIVAHSYASE